MIQQIVFTGHVRQSLDVDISAEDVRRSATFCEGFGITGLSLYADQTFITVLEGEKRFLDTVFESVNTNPRLSSVQMIYAEDIANREFGSFRYGVFGQDFSDEVKAAFLLNSNSFQTVMPTSMSPVLDVFFKTFARVNNLPFAQDDIT